jgi:hypothetical protein
MDGLIEAPAKVSCFAPLQASGGGREKGNEEYRFQASHIGSEAANAKMVAPSQADQPLASGFIWTAGRQKGRKTKKPLMTQTMLPTVKSFGRVSGAGVEEWCYHCYPPTDVPVLGDKESGESCGEGGGLRGMVPGLALVTRPPEQVVLDLDCSRPEEGECTGRGWCSVPGSELGGSVGGRVHRAMQRYVRPFCPNATSSSHGCPRVFGRVLTPEKKIRPSLLHPPWPTRKRTRARASRPPSSSQTSQSRTCSLLFRSSSSPASLSL